MTRLSDMSGPDFAAFRDRVAADFAAFKARGRVLNMTRGKPAPEQLDLSNDLLHLPAANDVGQADGGDHRNYGGIQGLPEARELFASLMGAPADRVVVGGNSSLALMHDVLVFAMLKGVPDGEGPWGRGDISFLCPVPGYDRHFAICEAYGIRMIPVTLTGNGPDVAEVERLAADPSVKGMWCVPKYSNPSGETYAPDVVAGLAAMKTGAPDFRLFWDNAYNVHHLTEDKVEVDNILEACAQAGRANRAFVFASTSKITFAGGGLALFASSADNVRWLLDRLSVQTIGPDKLNQLRHVRLLRDDVGLARLMEGHRRLLVPKFATLDAALHRHLDGYDVANWTEPKGGYFISLDLNGVSAKRVVALAKEAGVALVPAGSAYPYGDDPNDGHIRLAPTFPSLAEVDASGEGIALAILHAACEVRQHP